jgi:hypothetical protein
MFVQIAQSLGVRSISHGFQVPCAKLASYGLRNDQGFVHEAS